MDVCNYCSLTGDLIPVLQLPCRHVFHRKCLEICLKTQNGRHLCPVCETSVPTDVVFLVLSDEEDGNLDPSGRPLVPHSLPESAENPAGGSDEDNSTEEISQPSPSDRTIVSLLLSRLDNFRRMERRLQRRERALARAASDFAEARRLMDDAIHHLQSLLDGTSRNSVSPHAGF